MSSRSRTTFLPGYSSLLNDVGAKERYQEKLALIGGFDPYESSRSDWEDDVENWPTISCIHIGMYLLVTPSPYSGNDLLNYKSMDCFLSGWVREILVRAHSGHLRIIIAKVIATYIICYCNCI